MRPVSFALSVLAATLVISTSCAPPAAGPINPDRAVAASPSLVAEGSKVFEKIKSESKATVWTDRENFDKAADELVAKAEAWVKAAKGGDMGQTMGAMGGVGKACGGCHDGFKVDEDH